METCPSCCCWPCERGRWRAPLKPTGRVSPPADARTREHAFQLLVTTCRATYSFAFDPRVEPGRLCPRVGSIHHGRRTSSHLRAAVRGRERRRATGKDLHVCHWFGGPSCVARAVRACSFRAHYYWEQHLFGPSGCACRRGWLCERSEDSCCLRFAVTWGTRAHRHGESGPHRA